MKYVGRAFVGWPDEKEIVRLHNDVVRYRKIHPKQPILVMLEDAWRLKLWTARNLGRQGKLPICGYNLAIREARARFAKKNAGVARFRPDASLRIAVHFRGIDVVKWTPKEVLVDFYPRLLRNLRQLDPNVHILVVAGDHPATRSAINTWPREPGVIDIMLDDPYVSKKGWQLHDKEHTADAGGADGIGLSLLDLLQADVFIPAGSSFSLIVTEYRPENAGVILFPYVGDRTKLLGEYKNPAGFFEAYFDVKCPQCMWTNMDGDFDGALMSKLLRERDRGPIGE